MEKRIILANLLLALFEKSTSAVVVDRQNLPEQQQGVKVVLESFQGTEFSLSRNFRFAPCYLWFKRSESFAAAKEQIAGQVVVTVFDKMADLDYMMDDDLRASIQPLFQAFIASGIREEREGFCSTVKENLSVFLHGTPGIGKSTFVQTLAVALQASIRILLDEDIQVNIVKIPLNAYANAWNLNQILQVQGISDWSVERMMEQSLTKGNLVLLHLEECPASPELQDSFFVCLNKMLDRKLWFRYPDFKSNVMFVFTSNHEPSANIRRFCREYCSMKAPTEAMQRRWIQRKLKRSLASKLSPTSKIPMLDKVELTIEESALPKATMDVRPLNSFWISIGHALWRLHLREGSAIDHASFKVTRDGPNRVKVASTKLEETLETGDGYFYFSPSLVSKWKTLDAKSVTILNMASVGDLTPGVIVLKGGSEDWQRQTSEVVSKALQESLHPTTMFAETSITLMDPDDEIKVLGESGEIRGGLLKIIDDATNPNAAHKQKRLRSSDCGDAEKQTDICLVHARVNELGSVLLRELLEAGDKSRTHRLGVSKKGLVFIVSLIEGAAMTPQLESRAHQILTPQ
jgi:hypothetical protein